MVPLLEVAITLELVTATYVPLPYAPVNQLAEAGNVIVLHVSLSVVINPFEDTPPKTTILSFP